MTTMISEVYDALIEAGASESKARAAAIVLAEIETWRSHVNSELKILKWAIFANLGLTATIVANTLFS